MSRLSVLSWLTSGFVHTLAFALLGTLLTQVAVEQPDFFVPRGTVNASFSPPPRQTAMVEVEQPLEEETVEVPLPQPVPAQEEPLLVEEEKDEVAESEPDIVDSTDVIEEPLPPAELLAMTELATRPLEVTRRPRSSTRRRPALPSAFARAQPEIRQSHSVETLVSPVVVARTFDRQPEPQLTVVDATPTQRQTREADTPPVTTAEDSETEARQQEVAGAAESRPPRPLSNTPPEYPREAVRRRLEGTVKLQIRVGSNGVVLSVTVAESSGYAVLDESALRAIRDWTFSPRLSDGKPVESTEWMPVRFHLD